MRLKLHKPHVDHLTSKEKEKRKLMVKSAVTLRALYTFFSTTGHPSESSLLRNLRSIKGDLCGSKTRIVSAYGCEEI